MLGTCIHTYLHIYTDIRMCICIVLYTQVQYNMTVFCTVLVPSSERHMRTEHGCNSFELWKLFFIIWVGYLRVVLYKIFESMNEFDTCVVEYLNIVDRRDRFFDAHFVESRLKLLTVWELEYLRPFTLSLVVECLEKFVFDCRLTLPGQVLYDDSIMPEFDVKTGWCEDFLYSMHN